MQTRIANLLVVAGPSGCGKSCLIDELTHGRVPAELKSSLPDIGGWPQTSVKRLSRGQDTTATSPDLLVHYDTMRPYILGVEHYSRDLALVLLLSAATVTTILTVKIARDRLIHQYRARRSLFARLGFGRKLPLEVLYNNEELLAGWLAKWDRFCLDFGATLLTLEVGLEDRE